MFGVDTSELLVVVAVVALLFIGPKDLPKVDDARSATGSARCAAWRAISPSGIENVIREAELEEMEKKWREENERIMPTHPPDADYPEPADTGPSEVRPTRCPACRSKRRTAPDDDRDCLLPKRPLP